MKESSIWVFSLNVVVVEGIHAGFADIQNGESCVDRSVECLQEKNGGDRIEDFRSMKVRLGGVFLNLIFVAE